MFITVLLWWTFLICHLKSEERGKTPPRRKKKKWYIYNSNTNFFRSWTSRIIEWYSTQLSKNEISFVCFFLNTFSFSNCSQRRDVSSRTTLTRSSWCVAALTRSHTSSYFVLKDFNSFSNWWACWRSRSNSEFELDSN